MTFPALLLLIIVALTVIAFAREWMSMDVIALSSLALLLIFDLVNVKQAISGFSNPAVFTVMMMFILSEALVQSGLVTRIGHRIAEITDSSHWKASILLMLLTGVLSAFVNNTAAVSVLMPVSIHLARHFKVSPSKILMPLSFTAMFGGTCTLLGTSTNLVVSALAEEHGAAPFSMFEFLPLGAVLFACGLAYNLAVPMRYLKSRSVPSSLTRQYHLGGFLTELQVPAEARLIGKTVLEEQISERFQMNVIEILRGSRKISADLRHTPVEAGDILIVRGAMEDIVAFKEQQGLLLLTDTKLRDEDLSDEHTILAEVLVAPTSDLVGSTLREIDFRRRFGCFVLALARTGKYIRKKLAWISLDAWDTLLVFGSRSRVEALYKRDEFIPIGEHSLKLRLSPKWWVGALLIAAAVTLAALGVMPIIKAAFLAVVVLLITGRLTAQQAYRSIDWSVIFLLAGVLPLGIAMENTGLAEIIGTFLSDLGADLGPTVLISLFYLATGMLSAVFSNNATAVLMVPIAITAAEHIHVDSKPLLMAVAFAASASFMTPFGYQTNAMVAGPGAYRFSDFLKFGTPLNLIFWLLSSILIPVFWPLTPA